MHTGRMHYILPLNRVVCNRTPDVGQRSRQHDGFGCGHTSLLLLSYDIIAVMGLVTCSSMSLLVPVSATLRVCSQEPSALVTVLSEMHS